MSAGDAGARADDSAVTAHYGGADLAGRIAAALAAQGKDPERPSTRDLAPVDEFHSRGRRATEELAALAAPRAGERVLDVGSGIGGPARFLAEQFGCTVTGVDLTPAFCEVARWLSEVIGFADHTRFVEGSGTDIPLEDASFEIGWTIQMQMNVADKAALYAEIHRLLVPGGRFVLQELCAGDAGPCHYPAPWAASGAISHLVSPDALRAAVEAAGFETVQWRDTTDDALAWYTEANAKVAARPSALGTHLVMGDDAPAKRANVERNYAEGRLRQVLGAFVKRPPR